VEIINVNKEEEDKQKLFQEKVKELQALFQKESLDKLKDMSFIQDEQFENSTGVRLADEGDGEGQEGDTDEQEEID
jgi:acyl transferase domain-containing protein